MYFDYNASAPLRFPVMKLIKNNLYSFGNPSSIHYYGREVRTFVEKSRAQLAVFFAVDPSQVIFTSGATEANNIVVHGHKGPLIISAIEHDSIYHVVEEKRENTFVLKVSSEGVVDLLHLEELLGQTQNHATGSVMVCVMAAHNETGAVQPIQEIAALCNKYNAHLHCDAVQSVGRIAMDYKNIDSIAISGHKLGGLSGAGALIVSKRFKLTAQNRGGGQERGFRAGTENLLGIMTLGDAIEDSAYDDFLKSARRINRFETAASDLGKNALTIFSKNTLRLTQTCNIAMHGVKSDTQLMKLDLKGMSVSTGSACSSGKVKISRSLLAMGVSEEIAETAIRISIGFGTSDQEVDELIVAWREIYAQLSPHSTPEERKNYASL